MFGMSKKLDLDEYDALYRAFYRELEANGLQAKIFASGISEGTLSTYCGIYAKEILTSETRADFELKITSLVHYWAMRWGGTMEEFAQALSRAILTYKEVKS